MVYKDYVIQMAYVTVNMMMILNIHLLVKTYGN